MVLWDKALHFLSRRTIVSRIDCRLAVVCWCLLFTLKQCDSECIGQKVKYLQSYSLSLAPTSKLDFTLWTTDHTSHNIANFSLDNVTWCATGYVCDHVPGQNVTVNFTVQTFIDRIDVEVDKVNTISYCYSVSAIPSSFSCSAVTYSVVNGVNQARWNILARAAFPRTTDSTCSVYKQTQMTKPLQVVNSSFTERNVSTSREIQSYTTLYDITCLIVLTELDFGPNQFLFSMNYLSTTLNITTYYLNYTDFSFTYNVTRINIGDAVRLTCDTKLVSAQNFTIIRRGQQEVSNSTNDAHSLPYVIDSFTCQHIDEYECTVYVGTTTLRTSIPLSPYINQCAPQVVNANQQNRTFSVKPGDDLFISTDISSMNVRTLTFVLMFVEKGQTYLARADFYTVNCKNYSLYYCTASLALYDVGENDARNYFLSVADDKFETEVYFTLSSASSSNSYRDAVIGVSVVAGVLLLLVVALLVVILLCVNRRRRRLRNSKGSANTHIPDRPAKQAGLYDAMGSDENYGHNYGDDEVSPRHPAPGIPENAGGEGEKYELVTATKPPPVQHNKSHLPSVPGAVKKPAVARFDEETYENPTSGGQAPQEVYGNVADDQPIYGNV